MRPTTIPEPRAAERPCRTRSENETRVCSRMAANPCFLLVREGRVEPPRCYRHRILNPVPDSTETPSLTGFRAISPNPVSTGVATRTSGMGFGIFLTVPLSGPPVAPCRGTTGTAVARFFRREGPLSRLSRQFSVSFPVGERPAHSRSGNRLARLPNHVCPVRFAGLRFSAL